MAKEIKITFLGTSDSIPSSNRNHTAILLNYQGDSILFDCGEGTQRQFRKAGLNPLKTGKIILTHKHGDHILGLAGLLQTFSLSGYNKTLDIYGPKGIKSFVEDLLRMFLKDYSFGNPKYKINIKEVSGKFIETDDFYIGAESMTHGVPCNAYVFVKKGQVRINKDKLKKLKIKAGPFLRKLKEGKDIVYNGKKYSAKNLTFKEPDKKISIVLDTSINEKIVPFVKNSDILICESNFASDMEDKAREFKHLTSTQAAGIAKKSNSKKLVLTHISQRYENNPKKILDEAKKIFKNSYLAKDLDVISV